MSEVTEHVVKVIEETFKGLSPQDQDLLKTYLQGYPPDAQLEALDALVQLTWRQVPVSPREFIISPEYLNLVNSRGQVEIFPRLIDDLEELFLGQYNEAILTGGIGWGKSAFARIVHAYQIYQVGCLTNPSEAYGLQSGSKIVFINLAINKKNAEEVVFSQVSAMIDRSRWFTKNLPRKREKADHIEFENGVWLAPFAAAEKAVVGFDAFGGVMDEVNEMAYAFESTRKHRGEVVYDQAQSIRDALIRRMTSRFIAVGRLPGILVQMSSAKYPGEYTERRIKEAMDGDKSIFYRQYSTWATKPWMFGKSRFTVALGSLAHGPFILKNAEDRERAKNLNAETVEVPSELLSGFQKDIHSSIRDFIGRSTAALTPFISRIDKVFDAFQRGERAGLKHPFNGQQATLRDGSFRLDILQPRIDPTKVYFAHSDMAKNKHGNGDRAGLAIGHIEGYKLVTRLAADGKEIVSTQPYIVIDLMIQIVAPPEDEIRLSAIKGFLKELVSYGMRFASITFDQWQSLNIIQDLQEAYAAAVVAEFSVDKKNDPYMELKDAFYEDRIDLYEYVVVQTELSALEKNEKTGKVDHPPTGSKDVADCLAAIAFAMAAYKAPDVLIMEKGRGKETGIPELDRLLQIRERKATLEGVEPDAVHLTDDDILFSEAFDDDR